MLILNKPIISLGFILMCSMLFIASSDTFAQDFEWKYGGCTEDLTGNLLALTVYNGELIAGGAFLNAGGVSAKYIARWNGSSWQPLGSGTNWYVDVLTVYNGELIAGGDFATAGGVNVNYIARWNGSSWQSLGGGMDTGGVWALTIYNGELIAGGYFHAAGGVGAMHIARWNGSSWQPLGSGVSSTVQGLTVYNGELIAGGVFTTAGGISANRIARWNGSSWQPMGSGMNNYVRAFAVYNNELIVGGYFTTADGIPSSYIARWGPTNKLPVANAGLDQAVYAYIDNIADVNLDGSDSNDPDGDTLTYKWTWTIDSNTYEANGVNPIIELPVGMHTIGLVVNDGTGDSQSDYIDVHVVPPFQSSLKITPQAINLASQGNWIKASMVLPQGFKADDVDYNVPLIVEPTGTQSKSMDISVNKKGLVCIEALFDRSELCSSLNNENQELSIVGQFKTGQYFFGSDIIKVIGKKK